MGTIAEKLTYLNTTKTMLRESLNKLGAEILDNATFRSYLTHLDNLYNGLFNLTDMSKNGIIGRTSQEETPTPTTPQEIEDLSGDIAYSVSGKNLFSSQMELGTIDNDTGQNANGGNSIRSIDYIKVQPNTTYTISSTMNYHVLVHEYKADKTYIQYDGNYGSPRTFTTTENTYYIRVRSSAGLIENNLNAKYQLELGNSPSAYEQYVPKVDFLINLKSKNLFNDTLPINNTWVNYQGQLTTINGCSIQKLPCEPNTTYTLSETWEVDDNTNNGGIIVFYDENGNMLSRNPIARLNNIVWTKTSPENSSYMYVGHFVAKPKTIQLEKSNQSSTYEPYYDIHLDKISTYQDKIYSKDNKFYLHKEIGYSKYIGETTEHWTYYSPLKIAYVDNDNIKSKGSNVVNLDFYTNYFEPENSKCYISHTTGQRLHVNVQNEGISDISTTENWNTWLSTHNLDFYFVLDTPTTTEITSTSYPTLYNQLLAIQDYLIKYKVNNELILGYGEPNIKY